jgi:hypothetical protein
MRSCKASGDRKNINRTFAKLSGAAGQALLVRIDR